MALVIFGWTYPEALFSMRFGASGPLSVASALSTVRGTAKTNLWTTLPSSRRNSLCPHTKKRRSHEHVPKPQTYAVALDRHHIVVSAYRVAGGPRTIGDLARPAVP